MHVISVGAVATRNKPVQFGYISHWDYSTTSRTPKDERAALVLLRNLVYDPISPVERGVFERAYRFSIGLQPEDAKSVSHTQDAALNQYVKLPAHQRLTRLLELA